MTWPFSTRVLLPEAYWRVAPAETLTFGRNAATADRDPAAAVLVWLRAWTVWGEFRCASCSASVSEIGRAVESDASSHGPPGSAASVPAAAAVLSAASARALAEIPEHAPIANAAAMTIPAALMPLPRASSARRMR